MINAGVIAASKRSGGPVSINKWTQIPTSGVSIPARGEHGAANLGGTLYIHGGRQATTSYSTTFTVTTSGVVTASVDSGTTRYDYPLGAVASNSVIASGGRGSAGFVNSTTRFTVGNTSWSSILQPSAPQRQGANWVFDGTRYGYLLFGIDNTSTRLDSVQQYDSLGGTWAAPFTPPVSGMPGRYQGVSCFYQDKIYTFGGVNGAGAAGGQDMWVYDIAGNTWTQLTPTNRPSSRYLACGSIINDTWYVFGGTASGSNLNDLWAYDFAIGNWRQVTPTGTLPSGRKGASMTAIGNALYVFGGYSGDGSSAGTYNNEFWKYEP